MYSSPAKDIFQKRNAVLRSLLLICSSLILITNFNVLSWPKKIKTTTSVQVPWQRLTKEQRMSSLIETLQYGDTERFETWISFAKKQRKAEFERIFDLVAQHAHGKIAQQFVKMIVKEGLLKPNSPAWCDELPLHSCVVLNNPAVVQALLKEGADPRKLSSSQEHVLAKAFSFNAPAQTIDVLISHDRTLIDIPCTVNGRPDVPMHEAFIEYAWCLASVRGNDANTMQILDVLHKRLGKKASFMTETLKHACTGKNIAGDWYLNNDIVVALVDKGYGNAQLYTDLLHDLLTYDFVQKPPQEMYVEHPKAKDLYYGDMALGETAWHPLLGASGHDGWRVVFGSYCTIIEALLAHGAKNNPDGNGLTPADKVASMISIFCTVPSDVTNDTVKQCYTESCQSQCVAWMNAMVHESFVG